MADVHGSHGGAHSAAGHFSGASVNRRASLFIAVVVSAIALSVLGLQVFKLNPLVLVLVFLAVAVLLYLSPQRIEVGNTNGPCASASAGSRT